MFCLSDSVGTSNDDVGYLVSESRILHAFRNGKSTGNRDQDIPADVLAIPARIEYLCPSHDDSCHANEEEHVELETRHGFSDEWQLTNCSSNYH